MMTRPTPGKLYKFRCGGMTYPLYNEAYIKDPDNNARKTYVLPTPEETAGDNNTCLVVQSVGWERDEYCKKPFTERWVILFGDRLVVARAEFLEAIAPSVKEE